MGVPSVPATLPQMEVPRPSRACVLSLTTSVYLYVKPLSCSRLHLPAVRHIQTPEKHREIKVGRRHSLEPAFPHIAVPDPGTACCRGLALPALGGPSFRPMQPRPPEHLPPSCGSGQDVGVAITFDIQHQNPHPCKKYLVSRTSLKLRTSAP